MSTEERRHQLTQTGRVQVIHEGQQLLVVAPYLFEFNRAAKALGGQWRPKRHAWTFPMTHRGAVLNIIEETYGLKVNDHGKCVHTYVRVESGIKCMSCGLFKERSMPRPDTNDTSTERAAISKLARKERRSR